MWRFLPIQERVLISFCINPKILYKQSLLQVQNLNKTYVNLKNSSVDLKKLVNDVIKQNIMPFSISSFLYNSDLLRGVFLVTIVRHM